MKATNEQRNQWLKKIEDFKSSEKTKVAWCKEKNISISTFNYWNKKFKKESKQENKNVDWISINPNEPIKTSMKSNITIKIGCASIEINEAINPDFLFQVFKTIKTL